MQNKSSWGSELNDLIHLILVTTLFLSVLFKVFNSSLVGWARIGHHHFSYSRDVLTDPTLPCNPSPRSQILRKDLVPSGGKWDCHKIIQYSWISRSVFGNAETLSFEPIRSGMYCFPETLLILDSTKLVSALIRDTI